jgi:phospholipid/cholesterol/gamma-HCH transport system permease protein
VERQIYFTAWEILPGSPRSPRLQPGIHPDRGATARDSAHEYALELVIRADAEILPMITALCIALRTGAAINTEVALMKIQNEPTRWSASASIRCAWSCCRGWSGGPCRCWRLLR